VCGWYQAKIDLDLGVAIVWTISPPPQIPKGQARLANFLDKLSNLSILDIDSGNPFSPTYTDMVDCAVQLVGRIRTDFL
jgi:hypothetical protein